jgi:excisionase family DNA binding protein
MSEEKTQPDPRSEYPEIMTIEQAASYLQLHKQVVYRHVRKGTIPASRIGATIRFKKSVLDAWLEDSALKTLRQVREAAASSPRSPFVFELD